MGNVFSRSDLDVVVDAVKNKIKDTKKMESFYNIMVIGRPGNGKSSFLNSTYRVFTGCPLEPRPVIKERYGRGIRCTYSVDLLEISRLRLWDVPGLVTKQFLGETDLNESNLNESEELLEVDVKEKEKEENDLFSILLGGVEDNTLLIDKDQKPIPTEKVMKKANPKNKIDMVIIIIGPQDLETRKLKKGWFGETEARVLNENHDAYWAHLIDIAWNIRKVTGKEPVVVLTKKSQFNIPVMEAIQYIENTGFPSSNIFVVENYISRSEPNNNDTNLQIATLFSEVLARINK